VGLSLIDCDCDFDCDCGLISTVALIVTVILIVNVTISAGAINRRVWNAYNPTSTLGLHHPCELSCHKQDLLLFVTIQLALHRFFAYCVSYVRKAAGCTYSKCVCVCVCAFENENLHLYMRVHGFVRIS
jgi:hypothetical protein